MYEWVLKYGNVIDTKNIVQSFKKDGISNGMDSSKDYLLYMPDNSDDSAYDSLEYLHESSSDELLRMNKIL